jgi:hypothetical protein
VSTNPGSAIHDLSQACRYSDNMMHILVLTIIVATTTYAVCSVSQPGGRGTHLSTFRTENLKIRAPGKRFSSIVDEAIWLMRTHFLKRQMLTKRDWDKLPSEFSAYNDVNKVPHDLFVLYFLSSLKASSHKPNYVTSGNLLN